MKTQYTRKDFFKATGKASCALVLMGGVSSLVQSCSSIKVYPTKANNGKIMLPLTEFAQSSVSIVRVEGLQYDIMVSRKSDETFSAVLMRCSHQDWNLTANAKGLYCGLHGSAFDTDGNVKTGPATEPLKKFKIEQQDQYLIIS